MAELCAVAKNSVFLIVRIGNRFVCIVKFEKDTEKAVGKVLSHQLLQHSVVSIWLPVDSLEMAAITIKFTVIIVRVAIRTSSISRAWVLTACRSYCASYNNATISLVGHCRNTFNKAARRLCEICQFFFQL